MDIIGTLIGLAILVVIGIPLISGVIVVAFTAAAMGLAIVGSMALYVVGIPLAIWHRAKYGYWA